MSSTKTKIQVHVSLPVAPQIRVVFMGTPDLAASVLTGLIKAGYNIVGVVTQPDRPTGRAQALAPSSVKQCAIAEALPLLQPERLDATAVREIKEWKPDLIIVAAYGRILPPALLEFPGFGCVNVHTSLLPRWRGASPIQNALLAGDTETGVTIMLLDQGMDTGAILAKRSCTIQPHDRADTLTAKLAEIGTTLLLDTLPLWVKRKISPVPQATEGATLCQLIEREDGRVFWDAPAVEIYNRYRGLYPWPGLFTFWKRGEHDLVRLKLHTISHQNMNPEQRHPIGFIFEVGKNVGVQTGQGLIFLENLQVEGKTTVSVQQFLLGNPNFIGSFLIS